MHRISALSLTWNDEHLGFHSGFVALVVSHEILGSSFLNFS